ncbi:MAG: response regulator [Pseudomonadota bacterium]
MGEKKKILIIDDEKDLVDLLSQRLEAYGYDVVAAYDGEEGLDKARKTHPNLILLDIMMPKMDGYQVCRFLKFDEDFKNVPVVMLTARSQESDVKVGKSVGADDYITKPFESADLLAIIKKHLGE